MVVSPYKWKILRRKPKALKQTIQSWLIKFISPNWELNGTQNPFKGNTDGFSLSQIC